MLNLNLPRTDVDLATEGKWFPFSDEISFKVAQDGNPAHTRALQSKLKQIQKLQDKGDYARAMYIHDQITCKTILRGWKGIREEDGKGKDVDLPFSEDSALTIITNPAYKSIKEFVQDMSRDEQEFEEVKKEIVKNS